MHFFLSFFFFCCSCRLINLVAEDNAIEDTMYHLHRALNSGRIDLERFLRVSDLLFWIFYYFIPCGLFLFLSPPFMPSFFLILSFLYYFDLGLASLCLQFHRSLQQTSCQCLRIRGLPRSWRTDHTPSTAVRVITTSCIPCPATSFLDLKQP